MVWTMAFVYVGEIYPTLWRSTGSGLASGAARIGSMIAPQLVFTNPSLRNVFEILIDSSNLVKYTVQTESKRSSS